MNKFTGILESPVFYLAIFALALLAWWFGVLRQFIFWYIAIGFATFIVMLIWMHWEDRPEVPFIRKIALTIGWLYLFITVNLLMAGEPVDTAGWVNPTHAIGAVFIAIFYPFVLLYRLLSG